MLLMLACGVALLALFPFVEARAAEPILPPELFRNRTYSTTSAIGFVVGVSLFGAVTFLPLYLQVVRGHTPTASGLLMTPMMAGLLATSIASGYIISRTGRYRRFPIAGTALATAALYLLSRLGVTTSTATAGAYMLLLGLGIGMVLQVIVLAAQNAVPYRLLGVATSGSALVRQVGGSIGVAVFGAIFSNQLTHQLAQRLPNMHVPTGANPELVKQLPPAIHAPYVASFAAALHPVFLVAAAIAFVAFCLSWLLRDVPLRESAAAATASVGETFAVPGEDNSARELERIASAQVSGRERHRFCRRAGDAAKTKLTSAELCVLAQVAKHGRATAPDLATDRLAAVSARLERRRLVSNGSAGMALTPAGRLTLTEIVDAGLAELSGRCAVWKCDEDPEAAAVLRGVAESLVEQVPAALRPRTAGWHRRGSDAP
jgi:MFS family permease